MNDTLLNLSLYAIEELKQMIASSILQRNILVTIFFHGYISCAGSYLKVGASINRPDGQPCLDSKEFNIVRNMLIAAVEERYRDAGIIFVIYLSPFPLSVILVSKGDMFIANKECLCYANDGVRDAIHCPK